MGLTDSAHKLVREFSGGMIRRLEIIQSMLHRPDVLFLDEPTIGLDPAARRDIWRGLQDLTRQTGTALFITTHDMEEAETLCDRVAIMLHGSVIREGAPLQLRAEIGPHATLEDVFIPASGPTELTKGGSVTQLAFATSHADSVERFGMLAATVRQDTATIADMEVRKLRHDPLELLTRAVQPVLWLLIFGTGDGAHSCDSHRGDPIPGLPRTRNPRSERTFRVDLLRHCGDLGT